MKKKNLLFLIFPSLLLVLELLPFGVVLNFANPEGTPWRKTYSYFNLTPWGYAMFPPLLIAILTSALTILTVLYLIKQTQRRYNAVVATSSVALGLSLVQFLYGLASLTLIGIFVPILLLIHLCFFVWKGKP